MFCSHISDGFTLKSAAPTTVALVLLVGFLAAGQSHFIRVDHHHKVAGIQMWCVNGLVPSAQDVGCFFREPPEHLAIRVNDTPLASLHVNLWQKSLHSQ